MKKYISILPVALLALVSCSKDQMPASVAGPCTFQVEVPSIEDPETMLTFGASNETSQSVNWAAGDAFSLYTFASVFDQQITDCGAFTTSDSGSSASFTGTIPDGANGGGTNGVAIFPYVENRTVTTKVESANTTYLFKANVPLEQDGTGVKYMVAKADLKNGELGEFTFLTSLLKFNLSCGSNIHIKNITLQMKAEGSLSSSAFLAGDCDFSVKSNGGTSFTKGTKGDIVITKSDDSDLSGDIYIAVRSLTNNDFFPINLTFIFTTAEGFRASKTITLTRDKKINGARVYDFGTISVPDGVLPSTTVVTTMNGFSTGEPGRGFPYTFLGSLSGSNFHVYNEDPRVATSDAGGDGVNELSFASFMTERTYQNANGYDYTFGGGVYINAGIKDTKDIRFMLVDCDGDSVKDMPYVLTPLVPGKKLCGLRLESRNSATSAACVTLKDTEGNVVTGGESAALGLNDPVFMSLMGTSTGTQYRLYIKERLVTSMTFYYR